VSRSIIGRRVLGRNGRSCTTATVSTLKSFLTSKVTTVLKHVTRIRMERPKRSFSWLVWGPWDFDEAIVEGQRVTNRILPSLLVLTIIRKEVHDELIDLAESKHFRL